MSDEQDNLKNLKEAINKEFGHTDDISQEEWQALEFSEKQRAVFLHVFKHYDFTIVDTLLNNIDSLKEVAITPEQVLAAWESGKSNPLHTRGSKKQDA